MAFGKKKEPENLDLPVKEKEIPKTDKKKDEEKPVVNKNIKIKKPLRKLQKFNN